jgi:hypothetical protein
MLEPADDIGSWDELVCPDCGSDMVYFERIRPPGVPPYFCEDCGCEGGKDKFMKREEGGR